MEDITSYSTLLMPLTFMYMESKPKTSLSSVDIFDLYRFRIYSTRHFLFSIGPYSVCSTDIYFYLVIHMYHMYVAITTFHNDSC